MFTDAIDNKLLLLIEKFSNLKEITERFYLAGGTALTLQLGHRKSEDLDFFSLAGWDGDWVETILLELDGKVLVSEARTVHGLISEL